MRKFNKIKQFVQKNGEEGTVRDECLSPDGSATEVAVEERSVRLSSRIGADHKS